MRVAFEELTLNWVSILRKGRWVFLVGQQNIEYLRNYKKYGINGEKKYGEE